MQFRTFKSLVEYAFFSPLNWLARHLSFRGAGRFGSALGALVFAIAGYRKRVSLENLAHAFPEKSQEEIRRIAGRAYRGYGRALLEMLWSGGADESALRKTVRLVNREVPLRALEGGHGLILLSGHFGAWEFLVTSLRLNLGEPIVAIVQPQRNKYVDAIINANRNRFGSGTVTMQESVREVLKLLSRGKIVGMLGDQSAPKEAVFVDFFGRPAATHRGAAAFSLKKDSPIVMFFMIRQPDGAYDIVFEEVDRRGLVGSTEEQILELTRRHTAILERYIRRYPDHWLWMHKRWKHTAFFESQHSDTGRPGSPRVGGP